MKMMMPQGLLSGKSGRYNMIKEQRNMESKEIKEKQALVKKYLSLDNVSFLLGAGTSFHLGTPIIRNVPNGLKASLQDEIETYFASVPEPSFENLFNCLQADFYLKQTKREDCSKIKDSMGKMQRWLFEKCNTEKTTIHESYSDDKRLKGNRYFTMSSSLRNCCNVRII